MTDVMTSIIVTNGVVVNIRDLSRRMGKVDLDGMFTTPLSATGLPPATHWISSGLIRPAYLNAMGDPVRLYTIAKRAWEDDGDVFPFTQAQVTNALSKCTVSDGTITIDVGGVPTVVAEGPHELIARLGLKLVQEAV